MTFATGVDTKRPGFANMGYDANMGTGISCASA